MSLFVSANPCDTELFGKNAYSLFEIKRKRLQFKTLKSPALRGFVGGLRALATAALYLVIFSNGDISPQNTFKTGINAP